MPGQVARAQAGHLAPARSERSGEPGRVDGLSTRGTLAKETDEPNRLVTAENAGSPAYGRPLRRPPERVPDE